MPDNRCDRTKKSDRNPSLQTVELIFCTTATAYDIQNKSLDTSASSRLVSMSSTKLPSPLVHQRQCRSYICVTKKPTEALPKGDRHILQQLGARVQLSSMNVIHSEFPHHRQRLCFRGVVTSAEEPWGSPVGYVGRDAIVDWISARGGSALESMPSVSPSYRLLNTSIYSTRERRISIPSFTD